MFKWFFGVFLSILPFYRRRVKGAVKKAYALTDETSKFNNDSELMCCKVCTKFKPLKGSFTSKDSSYSICSPDCLAKCFALKKLKYCEICAERKLPKEFRSTKDCSHCFCADCIVKYIASKTQEGISSIKCPEPSCKAMLEPDQFAHSTLPKHVFEAWCSALCLATIDESQRFYCPFKDCSGLLVDEGDIKVKKSECPYCRRLFCAQCRVSWHSGIECKEYQKLNKNERGKEDIMLFNLAKQRKWKRCPRCKFYVERTEGCSFMRCRCGSGFCYNCGGSSRMNESQRCNKCM